MLSALRSFSMFRSNMGPALDDEKVNLAYADNPHSRTPLQCACQPPCCQVISHKYYAI